MKVLDRPENIRPWMEDESKKRGTADRVFFPETEAGVREILQNTEGPVTVQGGLTGVTAGAVPDGGIVINLSGMTGILTEPDLRAAEPDLRAANSRITVQPGLRLCSLREYLQRLDLFFAPDPTETTATLGGMVSCDSSGARSFHYGATRNHVRSIRVVLADGDVLCMQRGQYRSNGNAFRLVTEGRRVIEGMLPELPMPHVKKHTAGYYIRPDMDLMDLFIGSEGTLGIVTEIGLDLLPLPAHLMGAVIFFPEETSAVRFTRLLRENAGGEISESGTRLPLPPLAIEFFGTDTLFMLRSAQETGTALTDLPHIPKGCAVYTEFASDDRSDLPSLVHGPADLQFQFRGLAELIRMAGGMPDSSWVAFRGPDMERLKAFRHAAPVCVNERISELRKHSPGITKLGTDMSVPDRCLEEVFDMYRTDLQKEGFQTSLFGHIGNNHLHCNIMPRTDEEYARGKALYTRWAEEIVRMGGSVSAEHGIGKLKIWLLQKLYSEKDLQAMADLKRLFDPQMRLSPGNMFTDDMS